MSNDSSPTPNTPISGPSSTADREDSDRADGRIALTGLDDGGLSSAFEALDRHLIDVAAGLGDKTAIRWLRRGGTV